MRALIARPTAVWASLIVLLGIFIFAGSLPIDMSTRRSTFGAIAAGITLVAVLCTLLIAQRAVRSALLALCAIGFSVLLLNTRSLTLNSQLPASMMIAVLLSIALTGLRISQAGQNGWNTLELFAALLIVLTPVWALYSIPATFAHQMGLWPAGTIYLAVLWGIPVAVAVWVSRPKATTSRRLLANVAVAAASTLFTLALLDVGIRLMRLDQVANRPYIVNTRTVRRYPGTPENPGLYKPNQVGSEKLLSYDAFGREAQTRTVTYTINSDGFRGSDFVLEKPPSTYRVALVGDSFAFGLHAEEDKIVANLLGPMLSQSTGCHVEVYNFGVSAFSTVNEAALFKDTVVNYHPDMVVVWYFLNDPNLKGTTVFLGSFDTADFFPIAQKYSALAHLAALRLGVVVSSNDMLAVYRDGYALDDERWINVVNALRDISQLSAERKITPVLFVQPVLYQLDDSYPFKDIHAQVMSAAEGAGFHSYDLFDAFKGQSADTLWATPDNQHPNEAGHAIAARYAADRLKDLIPSCGSRPQ